MARPPVNALNDELIRELDACSTSAIADDGISVLHIRSDQRVFCAGADLALMHALLRHAGGADAMTEVVRRCSACTHGWRRRRWSTLAEIGAAALGGGLELALACDLRVAALDVTLGLPEAGLGLLPGAGGTQRLTRLCGPGVAKRMILGAELIDGAQAEQLGIVQWARRVGRARAVDGARWRRGLARDAESGAGGQQALHRRAGRRARATATPRRSPRPAPYTITPRRAAGREVPRPQRGTPHQGEGMT